VLASPYIAFGKLNLPDKLAFSASSLAFCDHPPFDREKTGILLAIPRGSLSTDRLYAESISRGIPSPALFSATLPSSPVADIAIYHRITGPDIVFAGGDAPFLSALEYGMLQLRSKRLIDALVVLIDEGTETPGVTDAATARAAMPSSCALLLGPDTETGIAPASQTAWIAFEYAENCFNDRTPPSGKDVRPADLIAALRNRNSLHMPVSAGAFKGYISVNYEWKER
jgi:hypothetical protein